jgi:hypothetical protein
MDVIVVGIDVSKDRTWRFVQPARVLAIMEFDGGLSRDEAEREAWALVSERYRLH